MVTENDVEKLRNAIYPDEDMSNKALVEHFKKIFTNDQYSHASRHSRGHGDAHWNQVKALNRMMVGKPASPGNFSDTRRITKPVEGNYISEFEGWSATMELMYSKAGEILKWLDDPNTACGDSYSVSCQITPFSDEYDCLGQGFLTDRNGFLHEYSTNYTCAVFRKDASMPYGFQLRTCYNGAGKEYRDQCTDEEIADIYKTSNDSVANYMKETDYFKTASPTEKAYLLYISDSSNPYKCRIYQDKDESSYIILRQPLQSDAEGHRMEHRLTISEHGLQLNLYKDEAAPTDTKPNWHKMPIPEAEAILGKESIYLRLNKPEQVEQFLELSPGNRLLQETGEKILKDIKTYKAPNHEKIIQDAQNMQPEEATEKTAEQEKTE